MSNARHGERGATLLIVLIMLVMLTLFAISAMNTGNINLKVVGNMQSRAEAGDATMTSIDNVISTVTDDVPHVARFVATPNDAIKNPCGGTPNTLCLDINGDGVADYTTTLTPAPLCVKARPVKVSELVITPTSEDLACTQAQQQGTFGVSGAASTGDSLCANTVWEITAQTLQSGMTAATSPVNVIITQGIAVRVKSVDMLANCP